MKDVIYAGFSQLSYLDWHSLDNNSLNKVKNNSLSEIFKTNIVFNQIKTPDYNKWDKGNNEYYVSLSEEGHKIYAKEILGYSIYIVKIKNFLKINQNFHNLEIGNFFVHMTIIKSKKKLVI
jgi:hypothetical protein